MNRVAAVVLVFFSLFFAACGPTTPPCGPTTCSGCCDASGLCQSGSAATACGSGGLACAACLASNQVCTFGVCTSNNTGNGGSGATGGGSAAGGGSANGGGEVGGGSAAGGGTFSSGGGSATGGGTFSSGGGSATGGGTFSTGGGSATGGGTTSSGGGSAAGGGTSSSGGGSASCAITCPQGFSCIGNNVCTGNLSNLVLNETAYTVSGSITVNGQAPTRNSTYCTNYPSRNLAIVTFTDASKDYVAKAYLDCSTTTNGFTYSLLLPPGTYEVRVDRGSYAFDANVNLLGVSYLAASAVQVNGNLSGLVLAETGYTVSGSITVNGQAPTRNSTYCTNYPSRNLAIVTFTDASKDYVAKAYLDCSTTTNGFTYSLLLPPGTYEVRVDRGSYAFDANVNLLGVSYLAASAVQVNGNLSGLVLAETGYTVSGSITVNGQAPTRNSTYCTNYPSRNLAIVTFTDASKDYVAKAYLDCSTTTNGFTYSLLLPPGTYEVRVDRGSYAFDANVNLLGVSYLAASAVQVNGNLSGLVLAETGYTVSGSITVNGQAPTRNSTYCTNYPSRNLAIVTFTDASKDYVAKAYLDCSTTTNGFTYSLLLPPGTYEVRVDRGTYAFDANVNLLGVSYLAATAVQVNGNLSGLVLAETGYTVSGSITVNGQAPTRNSTYCTNYPSRNLAIVTFTDASKDYVAKAYLDCSTTTNGFTYSLLLPPGTYEVRVDRGSYAFDANVNLLGVSYLAASAVQVNGNLSGLVLAETGYTVSGSITVNGQAPTRNSTYCTNYPSRNLAIVTFTDASKDYVAKAYLDCSTTTNGFTYSLLLPPGTYEVRVDRGSYAFDANVNLLGVSYLAAAGIRVP